MTQYHKEDVDRVIVRFLNIDRNFKGENTTFQTLYYNEPTFAIFQSNAWKTTVTIFSELV